MYGLSLSTGPPVFVCEHIGVILEVGKGDLTIKKTKLVPTSTVCLWLIFLFFLFAPALDVKKLSYNLIRE